MRLSLVQSATSISLLGLLWLAGRAQGTQLDRQSLATEDTAVIASSLEAEGGLPALSRAVLLRRAIGQPAAAAADIEQFLATLSQLSAAASVALADKAAAEAFFDDVLDEATWPDAAAWQALMRRFIGALSGGQLSALRLRAEVALAAQLWQQSCPVSGDDGACVKRVDAAALCRNAQHQAALSLRSSHPGRYLEFPCNLPNFAYRVYKRREPLVREAQRLLNVALSQIGPAQLQPTNPGDPLDEAIAHARFLLAEPGFEEALTLSRWPGAPATLDPSPNRFDPKLHTNAREVKWFQVWYSKRMINFWHARQQPTYERILSHRATRWAVAAQARLGQLFLDYTDQITGCASPTVMRLGYDPSRVFRCCYFGDDPPLAQAKERLTECAITGSQRPQDDPYVRFCEDALEKLSPSEWPRPYEISPQPTWLDTLKLTVAPMIE